MLYKRISKKFERNTKNSKWREVSTSVDYCGEKWVDKMTTDDVAYFNAIHWARGGRIRYSDNRYFTFVYPDSLEKVYDLFEPLRIPWDAMGAREHEALSYATWHMRCTEATTDGGHELLDIHYVTDDGDERHVVYDLTEKRFVG